MNNEQLSINNDALNDFWLLVLRFGLFSVFIFQFSVLNTSAQSSAYKTVLEGMYKKTVPLITCKELKSTETAIILDTRSKKEYEISHIRHARWVGYEEFKPTLVEDLPKNAAIVVYCSVGYRSERIGEQLLQKGYKNVRNLYGGVFEWSNQNKELVDTQNKPTHKVHAYNQIWGIWLQRGEKVYEK